MYRNVAVGAVVCLVGLASLLAPLARAADGEKAPAWRKCRPDAPEEPKAVTPYACAYPEMPKDWKPPATLDELEKSVPQWTDFPLKDAMKIGRERAESMKPLCSVEEALKLKNDSAEDNKKILSALCQYPKSDDEVDWDATINRWSGPPNTLNPILASSKYEFDMTGLIGAGYLAFDHKLRPFGDTDSVKRWRRSPLVELIELRDDLVWEDGEPITAEDVVFTWHVMLDPRVPATAVRSEAEELKWVKAYGPHVLAIFHKEPLATNIWNASVSILPKHIYERSLVADPSMKQSQWHAYWNRKPLSGGGYVVKDWESGQYVTFERRESAYMVNGKQVRSKPYFKTVRFRLIDDPNSALLALEKGELDEMLLTVRQWQMQTNDEDFYRKNTKVTGPEWTYACVVWNLKRPWFADKRVRKAIALAFDMPEYLKHVCFGLYPQCAGPENPDSPWGTPDEPLLKQDLDAAEKLLDDAGWKLAADGVRAKDGKRFEFTVNVPLGGMGDKVAAVLQQNLKDVGIIMNVKMLEWATYAEKTDNHDFDAGIQAWGTGTDPDLGKNVWKTEMYQQGRNYGGYSNPRVDELFEEGRKEFDFEKRRKIYQEINRLIYEDQPYLFLNYRCTFWAFSKDLRGYNLSPRDPMNYSPGFSQIWKPKKKAQ